LALLVFLIFLSLTGFSVELPFLVDFFLAAFLTFLVSSSVLKLFELELLTGAFSFALLLTG
jgi:hypothetical protein